MTHEKNEPIGYDPSPRPPTPLHPIASSAVSCGHRAGKATVVSAIVTPELVRRYIRAVGYGQIRDMQFVAQIEYAGLSAAVEWLGIDRAKLGMLAAAEMDFDLAKANRARGSDAEPVFWHIANHFNMAGRAKIEAAGVDPKAWEAAR